MPCSLLRSDSETCASWSSRVYPAPESARRAGADSFGKPSVVLVSQWSSSGSCSWCGVGRSGAETAIQNQTHRSHWQHQTEASSVKRDRLSPFTIPRHLPASTCRGPVAAASSPKHLLRRRDGTFASAAALGRHGQSRRHPTAASALLLADNMGHDDVRNGLVDDRDDAVEGWRYRSTPIGVAPARLLLRHPLR